MSGGYFDYAQYRLSDMMTLIAEAIEKYKDGEDAFSEKTIQEFRNGIAALERARIYAQRIDWLVSGDDGEEDFHRRLAEELS